MEAGNCDICSSKPQRYVLRKLRTAAPPENAGE